jgi:uncharacterized damage-inducible protein DinB
MVVREENIRYLRHLAARVEKHARAVPAEKLGHKPFGFGNSMGHLVLHLTGNLNHYIGAGIAGTGYVRDRPREFTEMEHPEPGVLLERFHAAVEMVARTIAGLDEASWIEEVIENPPIRTRYGLVLVCLAHLNNHIGQMSYLVQALGCSTQEPPVW